MIFPGFMTGSVTESTGSVSGSVRESRSCTSSGVILRFIYFNIECLSSPFDTEGQREGKHHVGSWIKSLRIPQRDFGAMQWRVPCSAFKSR